MKQILVDIAKALVTQPDEVEVVERREGDVLHLELNVAPEDKGKVIGKQGRIAKAIRSVMKACAAKENVKVVVDII